MFKIPHFYKEKSEISAVNSKFRKLQSWLDFLGPTYNRVIYTIDYAKMKKSF
jgi:hypothetical protein